MKDNGIKTVEMDKGNAYFQMVLTMKASFKITSYTDMVDMSGNQVSNMKEIGTKIDLTEGVK